MLKTVYHSSCRDKHNCQRRDSNLDPLSLTPQSDALTTRLLRPAKISIVSIRRVLRPVHSSADPQRVDPVTRDAFVGRARRRRDLAGCAETGTISAVAVAGPEDRARGGVEGAKEVGRLSMDSLSLTFNNNCLERGTDLHTA